MSRMVLTGAAVLQAGDWVHDLAVVLEGGSISAVSPQSDAPAGERVRLPQGSLLAPGLIDIQVNGGGGILFNDDPSREAACAIAAAHRRLGTTGILPTLITDTRQKFSHAAEAAGPGPGILGAHFEGPFLSASRPGVHPPEHIRAPEEADLACLETLARRQPGKVLVTLAPETVNDIALRRLRAAGIRLSAGHSAATFERVADSVAAGITGFTHVFNAMPPLAGRAPGIAAAALLHPDTWCGVIADGFHVHQAMLRLLLAARAAGRIVLVSDAMPPTGADMQAFELQGRTIFRRDGRLVTADGTLAGADLCLAEAVRRATTLFGIAPAMALGMATAAPAAFLGIDHERGHIAPGFIADLVLLDQNLHVLGTWLAGAWQGEEVFG